MSSNMTATTQMIEDLPRRTRSPGRATRGLRHGASPPFRRMGTTGSTVGSPKSGASRNPPFRRMVTTGSAAGSPHVARGMVRSDVRLDRLLAEDSAHSTHQEPKADMLVRMPSYSAQIDRTCSIRMSRKSISASHRGKSSQHSKSSVLDWEDSVSAYDSNSSTASFCFDNNEDDMGVIKQALLGVSRLPKQPTHRTLEELASEAEVQSCEDDDCYEMELSPGYHVPFRGAKEVWTAVAANITLECTCLECGIQLVSVPDCEHVVCPDCRMVNPVFDRPEGVTNPYGAGIGLKKEWVESKRQNDSRH